MFFSIRTFSPFLAHAHKSITMKFHLPLIPLFQKWFTIWNCISLSLPLVESFCLYFTYSYFRLFVVVQDPQKCSVYLYRIFGKHRNYDEWTKTTRFVWKIQVQSHIESNCDFIAFIVKLTNTIKTAQTLWDFIQSSNLSLDNKHEIYANACW